MRSLAWLFPLACGVLALLALALSVWRVRALLLWLVRYRPRSCVVRACKCGVVILVDEENVAVEYATLERHTCRTVRIGTE